MALTRMEAKQRPHKRFNGKADTPVSVKVTDDSTKSEIKEYLDAQGIEYDSSATKVELLDLI